MGGWVPEQERLCDDQHLQVNWVKNIVTVVCTELKWQKFSSDCDLNKFWQFILEQSIQVLLGLVIKMIAI